MNNRFDNSPHGSGYGFDFYDEIVVTDAKKDFSRVFLALFFFTLASLVYSYIIGFWVPVILEPETVERLFSNIYFVAFMSTVPMYIIGLPIIIFLVRKIPTRFKAQGRRMSAGEFIMLIPICSFFSTVGNFIGNALNGIISVILDKEIVNSVDELISRMPIWLILVLVVIIAPIVEEFIFRKLLLDRLSRYGAVLSIVVTALAFGAFHGNFYQFFYTTLVGLVLGYIAYKSGNWLYAVLMHMIFNFLGGVLPMMIYDHLEVITSLMEELEGGATPDLVAVAPSILIASAYLIFNYGLFIIGVVLVALKVSRREFGIELGDCEVSIPKRRVGSTVVLNVGFILFAIVTAITFIESILI